jgi:hypothetical protein
MIARHCWLGPALLLWAVAGCSGGASPSYGGGTGGSGAPGATPGAGSNGVAGLGGTQQAGGAPSASNPKASGGGAPGTGGTASTSGAGGASGGPVANGTGGAGSPTAAAFPAGAKTSHFPLIDGASWTYHHTSAAKTAPWDETDTVKATTYMGKPAFIFEDQEDAMGVQTHSTLVVNGTGVYRAYKENTIKGMTVLTVTYNPAFLRFDEAWTQMGQMVTLTDNWTQNCVVGNTVVSKCVTGTMTPGMTTHEFTVLNASVKITVPAGTFDTIEIQRVDPMAKVTKLFWFAAGVGKVREEVPAMMAVEELTSYKIP